MTRQRIPRRAWGRWSCSYSRRTERHPQKGYGFIQPEAGDQDVFVHISALERSGLGSLNEGQKVKYEVERDQRSGKMSATNLQAV
jgi:cold shock protein